MPGTSLALLSWSEQVSQPHTRCSKGSPLGEAPISCYSYPHLPHRTLPARHSPSSLLHSHTTSFGNRFNTNPCLGNAHQQVVSPTKTVSNQQTRILGLCSHSPASRGAHPPHPLAFRDAQPQSCSLPRAELRGGKSSLQTTGLDQPQIHKPKGASISALGL